MSTNDFPKIISNEKRIMIINSSKDAENSSRL